MIFRLRVWITGIHCAGCFNQIDRSLRSLGSKRLDFDMASRIETIDYAGTEADAEKYLSAIRAAGFGAILSGLERLEAED